MGVEKRKKNLKKIIITYRLLETIGKIRKMKANETATAINTGKILIITTTAVEAVA